MEWMVWTPSVAIFFSVIILALVGMTVWGIKSPSVPRKGFLPMRTARGDRFFIGILGSAFINLAWLGFTDLTQWIGLGLSLVYMFIIARWG
jgi:predicted small integral membrane protein